MDLLVPLLLFLLSRADKNNNAAPPAAPPGAPPWYPWAQPGQGWGGSWYGPWTQYYPAPGYPAQQPPPAGPPPFFPPQQPPAAGPPGPWLPPWVAAGGGGVVVGPGGVAAGAGGGAVAPAWPFPPGGQPLSPPRPYRRIRTGDTGYGLAQKATGSGGRWRELLAENPELSTYTDAKGATQIRPWAIGQKIYLPADWAKIADGAEAPKPVVLTDAKKAG